MEEIFNEFRKLFQTYEEQIKGNYSMAGIAADHTKQKIIKKLSSQLKPPVIKKNGGRKKIFEWGHTVNKVDWHINSFYIDNQSNMVNITLEEYGTMRIEQIKISMETAERIGLLNWNSLAIFSL